MTGDSGANTLIGGSQSDSFFGFLGTDTIDGGVGFDVLALTATSSDLNTATDAQVSNIENVQAFNAAAGVTINLSNQTESLFIAGSLAGADIIVGGSGNDTLQGLGGADTLDGRDGSDTYYIPAGSDVVAGETISDTGSSGTDAILIFGGTISVDFTSATISGIEVLRFQNAGPSTVTFNANQFPANLQIEEASGGARTVNVVNASNFNASGWMFGAWNDTININGTIGSDINTQNSQADTIIGGGGDDTLEAVELKQRNRRGGWNKRHRGLWWRARFLHNHAGGVDLYDCGQPRRFA